MGNVEWIRIIIAGWPVLTVLLIGSILTVAICIERWKIFKGIHSDSVAFVDSIEKNPQPQQIISFCEKSDQPLAFITQKIFKTKGQREDRERILQRVIQSLVQKFEIHISILGTIASVAPFVGLLGTVLGIIKAFRAVATSATGGPGVVALGIAEALVGTAGGLIVAIPALLAYNYFVNRIRHLTQEWEMAGGEIIDISLGANGSAQ